MILVAVSFVGVFQYEESFFKSLKYWRGHHPIPILIILATVLTTRTRRVQMLNSLGLALLVIMIYSFCVYSYSPFENLKHFRPASIAKNTIWFGMAFVVWCGLWICVPFSLRLNPCLRPFLSEKMKAAMRAVTRLSTWEYLKSFPIQTRQVHFLKLIRYGFIVFCFIAIFGINPSRTAWVAVLAGTSTLLLLWNWRKGLLLTLLMIIALSVPSYFYSSAFILKVKSTDNEIDRFINDASGASSLKSDVD